MALDTEVLAILQKSALQGRTLESTGLEVTEEIRTTFETLKAEYANAPKRSMAFIVEDVQRGKYDALISATEKAHGPIIGDKTLQEMEAERKSRRKADVLIQESEQSEEGV